MASMAYITIAVQLRSAPTWREIPCSLSPHWTDDNWMVAQEEEEEGGAVSGVSVPRPHAQAAPAARHLLDERAGGGEGAGRAADRMRPREECKGG
jgi:hypothetical protein